MSIELGLILLINNAISSPPFSGGAYVELPPNAVLPNWTFKWISESQNLGLETKQNLKFARVEIDVYGSQVSNGSDSMDMARTITGALDGFSGLLPNGTAVSSCFKSDQKDLFDAGARTWRRLIEVELLYWA